jgi:hypothetical protein
VAADRTSASHNHKDAARSLWVALFKPATHVGEFIVLKFTGHPKLSPYPLIICFWHRFAEGGRHDDEQVHQGGK